ncbi:MAG TPA: hypothetical protein VMI75_03265 [Polyangiaceae bacterium]|nr:hypothetical protein [Polyangiaceae bacterium]
MRPMHYARVATALFAAEAIFAIVHLALGAHYHHFTRGHNVTIDILLFLSWSTAAVASLKPQTWPAPVLMMWGAAVSAVHCFMFTLATNDVGPTGVGLPFIAAAAVQFFCIFHAVPPLELTPVVPEPEPERRRLPAWVLRLRPTH